MDPAVKKMTGYIAVWVILLSCVMEAVFLLIGKWEPAVLYGNIGGAVVATGNFFLMAVTATRAMNRGVESGKPEEAAARVKATTTLRLAGSAGLCALIIAVFHTNPFATLIPMLFPRIGIMFWPRFNKNSDGEQPGTEGSDLID